MTLPVSALHLEAEVAAWPLWSEAAFGGCFLRLERTEKGVFGEPTRRLSDALLQHLRLRSRGLSLEQLRQFQEESWFMSSEQRTFARARDVSLEELLGDLASRHVSSAGGRFFVRDSPAGLEHQVARWRWLSLTLPPDLLIAAQAVAEEAPEPRCDHLSLGAEHLSVFFREKGVAQTHLHLGAAVPFELLWTHLMTRVPMEVHTARELECSAGTPFGAGATFLGWLLTAAMARLCLASFLWHQPKEDCWSFQARLARRGHDAQRHLAALRALGSGIRPLPVATLTPVARRLALPLPAREPEDLDQLRRADPLFRWLRRTEGALPETLLLYESLRFLRARRRTHGQTPDRTFERLFWQYVRIRNRTYRHLVQEPGTAGLDWFTTHFNRISSLRKGLGDRVRMQSALLLESREPVVLSSLEVRTSPPRGAADVVHMVREVAKAASTPGSNPERGLVLHFIKEHAPDMGRGQPHADPRSIIHGCRFGAFFRECAIQVRAIESALKRQPQLLVVLRGMDICNLELTVPTWVFAPLFLSLRRCSLAASNTLIRHGTRVPPFRFTAHVGEDYRRLVEGLRRIDEPLRFGLLGVGDRLGHAVALGVDPERWSRAFPLTRQPAEERLDDLLWEMDLYQRKELPVRASRVESVRGELGRLSRHIYDGHEKLEDLIEARRLRHDPAFLARMGYPLMRETRLRSATLEERSRWLAYQYLTDFGVYARGQLPVEVRVDEEEVLLLRELQRNLRGHIARRATTVEVNPSSNMLIADLPLEAHPIFAFQPLPGMRGPEGEPILVSLGDDDPITFASNLPDELCHLFYALIRRGVGSADALRWLDQLRDNGMRARFTVPLSATPPREPVSRGAHGRYSWTQTRSRPQVKSSR